MTEAAKAATEAAKAALEQGMNLDQALAHIQQASGASAAEAQVALDVLMAQVMGQGGGGIDVPDGNAAQAALVRIGAVFRLSQEGQILPEFLDESGANRGYPLPHGAALAPSNFAVGLTLYIPAQEAVHFPDHLFTGAQRTLPSAAFMRQTQHGAEEPASPGISPPMAQFLSDFRRALNTPDAAVHLTPLMTCTLRGDTLGAQLAAALLDRAAPWGGVDVHGRDGGPAGVNALMMAAQDGHPRLLRVLLAHGADPSAAPARGSSTTPLWIAAQNGNTDCVCELLQHGLSSRGLTDPAAHGGVVAAARTTGWFEATNNEGKTPLNVAVQQGHAEAAAALIAAGADPRAGTPSCDAARQDFGAAEVALGEPLRAVIRSAASRLCLHCAAHHGDDGRTTGGGAAAAEGGGGGGQPSTAAVRLKACSGCGLARFCGRQCQTAAWKRHKRVCKALARGKRAFADTDVLHGGAGLAAAVRGRDDDESYCGRAGAGGGSSDPLRNMAAVKEAKAAAAAMSVVPTTGAGAGQTPKMKRKGRKKGSAAAREPAVQAARDAFADDASQQHPLDRLLDDSDEEEAWAAAQARGVAWEFYDRRTKAWVRFPKRLDAGFESLFSIGAPHFLYCPGAGPEVDGRYEGDHTTPRSKVVRFASCCCCCCCCCCDVSFSQPHSAIAAAHCALNLIC
jgi:hypothetical protein